MRKEADPQTAEHPLRDRRGEAAVEERHRLDGGVGTGVEDREEEQASRTPDEQMAVDARPTDERWREHEASGGEHEPHHGQRSDPPRLQEAPKAPRDTPT